MKNLKLEASNANRDAVSKAIYQRLFGWIIGVCNETLIDKGVDTSQMVTLGLLDIFGFEDFATNSLEQMCINITNEQLQWCVSCFPNLLYSSVRSTCCKAFLQSLVD